MLAMDYKSYEIIILPNENPEKIPEYLRDKKIRIISTGKVSPAIKRDIGAKESNGKYLAFIDDDAYPQKDWLTIAEKELDQHKVQAVGGPAITPQNSNLCQKASGKVFETLCGGGKVRYRYIPAKNCFLVDDFPSVNLIVNKNKFLEVGGFDNKYWPGEDTKFCSEFIKRGYKIKYLNNLIVHHHRRDTIANHIKQVKNYGLHRGHFVRKQEKTSLKLNYFIPAIFVLGNSLFLIFSLVSLEILKIWGTLLGIYFVILSLDVFLRNSGWLEGILTITLIFFTHLFYGIGFIKGFFSKELRSQLR
jgi:GT2 family glycosyltransferase